MSVNVKTLLSNVGHFLGHLFVDATKVAAIAEPIVDIAFPGFASLYNLSVAAALKAEAIAVAANAQTGTGTQKLAMAVQEIQPVFVAWYTQTYGATPTLSVIQNYMTAVVATLNAIPAPTVPLPPSNGTPGVTGPVTIPSVSTQAATGTLL